MIVTTPAVSDKSAPFPVSPSSGRFARVVLLAITLLPSTAAAQAPVTPPSRATPAADSLADSTAARLRRAEEAIALLQQQLAEQAAGAVSTRSRMHLEITGRVLVHAFRNERRVNNVDDPQFVRPDTAATISAASLGLAIRQTTLGAVLTAPDVLGGRFIGDIDVDFYGGQQPSSGGRTFPLLRVRTARGTIAWSHGELLVGQESPLISGVSPVSPAAIGTPAFVTAGNLWLWLPQVRATLESPGPIRLALQGAVLASTTGDAVGLFDTDADAAERSRRPATEARVRLRWGEEERASEIGCGGHLAWIAAANDVLLQSRALACDARVALAARAQVRAEAFTGRGLRGLGGGGISQNFARSGTLLESRGGWAQLDVEVHSLLRVAAGCGVDAAKEVDVPAGGRLRNTACAGSATLHPAGPLFVGAEIRRLATRYANGTIANHHLNLAAGFEF